MNKFGINEALEKLITSRLKAFNEKSLDLVTCTEIYQAIFDTLVEVFESSNVQLSNESVNWLAQEYYDCVSINETQTLNPHIFSQRAKLEMIPTKEIALLATFMNGTDFTIPLIKEIKRRS
jgi:hypothetical protein